jgi:hypothetical protein
VKTAFLSVIAQCPLWDFRMSERCPLYHQKQTSKLTCRYTRRNSAGSLAMLAAIRPHSLSNYFGERK